ncbi:MAG: endonuclease III [Candidatus Peribacteraceae bacterium]|nr:endonuclease III [Candidatus Peribacteraceae bacterium]
MVIRGLSAKEVLQKLKKLYHPPRSFLHWNTPFELLVATVLSAQCTDERVNKVTEMLFRTHNTPQDFLGLPPKELEFLIHSCGTFRVKARYLHGISRELSERFGGKIPETMEELTRLPGVGRKTAAIILYAAFGKIEGIAVDTHVFRLARRLHLSRGRTAEQVERDLMRQFPQKEWGRINALFISHGRAVCTARSRKCEKCMFQKRCPSSITMGRRDLIQT